MLRIQDKLRLFKPSCGIYGIQNKLGPTKWYIGQSHDIHHRWKDYSKLRCSGQTKLYHALKKYGVDNFDARIIELCDSNIPQEVLDLKESMWITHYNSVEHGYNLTHGGGNGRRSIEAKQNMSMAQKGKSKSEQHRKKISETLTGRKLPEFSAEHKRNMSISQIGNKHWLGRTHSQETKNKLSIIAKNRVSKPVSEETKKKMAISQKLRREKQKQKE